MSRNNQHGNAKTAWPQKNSSIKDKTATKSSFLDSQTNRLTNMNRTQSQHDQRRLPRGRNSNIDFSNLATTRLPDVEPAVPVDTYLSWRYTNQRGASNMAFDRV